MIKIFLALVSVFAVLAVTMAVRALMFPLRYARSLFASKAVPA